MKRALASILTAFVLFSGVGLAQDWVGTWAASPMPVEAQNSLTGDDLHDVTVRQIVHLSVGGSELVLRLSNRHTSEALRISSIHVAQAVAPGSSKIVPGTDKALSFSGVPDVIIPPRADYLSDPIAFSSNSLSDLAITIYLEAVPAQQTGHTGSRTTSFVVHGNQVSAAEFANPKLLEHWYFLASLDVDGGSQKKSIVALGDSITDGHGATTDKNNRWPDLLSKQLHDDPTTSNIAIVNQGIGGNGVIGDFIGPNSLARFDHDVLAQSGGRWVFLLEGINDLGKLTREGDVSPAEHRAFVHRLTAGYEQIIMRAHQRGLLVIGATLTPFVGSDYYHPGPNTEADRQEINNWIRTPGHFDASVDFDKAIRDPTHPDRMLPEFDSGDHLHPSPAGYAAMASAVPLELFVNTHSTNASAPKLAFTFDDFPAHGPLPPGDTRLAIINKIIAALRDAKVPPTYGFLNGRLLQDQPDDVSVLKAWRDAGNPLGNHAWSHMNLNQHSVADFETDVERNESLLADWMKTGDWHWLRYPYLAEGDTPEKRTAIRQFLSQNGYKVAAVTMSFGDYQWSEPYARCLEKGDNTAVQSLKDGYLAAADQTITYTRSLSNSLYGHDIPYVLLMHIGAATADMLPRLIALYRARGFEFVSLAEAEKNDFYRESIDLSSPPTADSLEGVAYSRGMTPPPRATSSIPFATICK